MKPIIKQQFLDTVFCPTYGWEAFRSNSKEELSIFAQFQMGEGTMVQERARKLYPQGILISGDNITAAELTKKFLQNANVEIIFEATFLSGNFITKSDILRREGSGWRLIEIKSGTSDDKSEYLDDLAYTTMVVKKTGLKLVGSSLLLVSKEYRLGMSDDKFFEEYGCSDKIADRVNEFKNMSDTVVQCLSGNQRPEPVLKLECKKCPIFDKCCGAGIDHHILELPRISHTKFCQLKDMGIVSIRDIPSDFDLSGTQKPVWEAVQKGVFIDKKELEIALSQVKYPIYFLDFETVKTAIPLYENVAPHSQVPTQYSIHKCSAPGIVEGHYEYLADPAKDCRRELAERLVKDCGNGGTIFSYSAFEATVIKGLIELFPDIKGKLDGLVKRIIDLKQILMNYYHPDFHGSYSIKDVLPVMVDDLKYDGMPVGNGSDAIAVFARMARGEYASEECEQIKKDLLAYCKLDTLAMVKLTEKLWDVANIIGMERNDTIYKVGMTVKLKDSPWLGEGKIIKIQGSTIIIDFEGGRKRPFDSKKTHMEICFEKAYNNKVEEKTKSVLNESNEVSEKHASPKKKNHIYYMMTVKNLNSLLERRY
ncbi:MAG: DUF2779 domain-containing protein [Sedimentisphaerales bacterium]